MSLTVREVALRAPVTVSPETLICTAEQQLIAREASELYVIDQTEQLLGMVTDQEILNYRLMNGNGQERIATLMIPVAVSLSPLSGLQEGAQLLREYPYASLPILDETRLIGQLCRSDLLRLLAGQNPESPVDLLEEQVSCLPAPKFAQLQHDVGNSQALFR